VGLAQPAVSQRYLRYALQVTFVTQTNVPGLVISGGQDNIIYAHSPTDTANPVLTLVGHTGNVCALSVLQTDNQLILLSGSWDKTARVWDLGSGACLETLEGHEQAVWAVAAFENGQWLTGSLPTPCPSLKLDGVQVQRTRPSSCGVAERPSTRTRATPTVSDRSPSSRALALCRPRTTGAGCLVAVQKKKNKS